MGRLTDEMTQLRGHIDSSRNSRLAQQHERERDVNAQLVSFATTRVSNSKRDARMRADFVNATSKSTSDLLTQFNADRSSMAKQTAKERADFVSATSKFTSDLLTQFNVDHRSMADQTAKERADFVSATSKSTSDLLTQFNVDRRSMADQTAKERADFVSATSKFTSDLLTQFNVDRRSMAEQTAKELADFTATLTTTVSAFIDDFAQDRAGANAAFFGTVAKKKSTASIAIRLIDETPAQDSKSSLGQFEAHTSDSGTAELALSTSPAAGLEQTTDVAEPPKVETKKSKKFGGHFDTKKGE